jgi:hypothetical protein
MTFRYNVATSDDIKSKSFQKRSVLETICPAQLCKQPTTDVYLFGPPLYPGVPHITEFGVKEATHHVDSAHRPFLLPSLHYQVHVEIDDLIIKPVEASQSHHIVSLDGDVELLRQHLQSWASR